MSMRPVYYSYAPATEDDDGIADELTGAGPWDSSDFIVNGPTDELAHVITLKSGVDLSAITFTVTGTDADGQEVSEALIGPDNETVETTLFFKTVESISASGTAGANTFDVGWADEFVSQTIPLEIYTERDTASVQVKLSGTGTFDIETTLSDIRASYSPPPSQDDYLWLDDANFTNKSASIQANLATNARALRLAVNSYSAGASFEVGIVTPL